MRRGRGGHERCRVREGRPSGSVSEPWTKGNTRSAVRGRLSILRCRAARMAREWDVNRGGRGGEGLVNVGVR